MSYSEDSANESAPSGTPSSVGAALKDLRTSYDGLRALFNMVLIGSILVHLSLGIFMFREVRGVRRQIEENSRLVANYEHAVKPKIDELQVKLTDYARQHPAFAPVVKKYFGTNAPASSPAPPSAAIAPAPPPARR